MKIMKIKYYALGFFILGFAIINPTSAQKYYNQNETESLNELVVLDSSTHFYVIGDWGRNGHYNGKEVADIMQQAGFILEPDFIISTGDNLLPHGVASVHDPYFKIAFEDMYSGFNMYCPWYLALGNHDYQGNVQAQIDYTNISRRWNLPDRYYYKDIILEDDVTKARFIFIDTNPFEDSYYGDEAYVNITLQDTTKQKNWLIKTLSESDATWKIVIGHHPFYTSGKRINYPPYVRNHLESVFEKYKVDVYFAAHEHDLQHNKTDSIFTHHFISGAGSEIRPSGQASFTKFAKSVQGFMAVSMIKEKMLVQVVNWKGEVIYTTTIEK